MSVATTWSPRPRAYTTSARSPLTGMIRSTATGGTCGGDVGGRRARRAVTAAPGDRAGSRRQRAATAQRRRSSRGPGGAQRGRRRATHVVHGDIAAAEKARRTVARAVSRSARRSRSRSDRRGQCRGRTSPRPRRARCWQSTTPASAWSLFMCATIPWRRGRTGSTVADRYAAGRSSPSGRTRRPTAPPAPEAMARKSPKSAYAATAAPARRRSRPLPLLVVVDRRGVADQRDPAERERIAGRHVLDHEQAGSAVGREVAAVLGQLRDHEQRVTRRVDGEGDHGAERVAGRIERDGGQRARRRRRRRSCGRRRPPRLPAGRRRRRRRDAERPPSGTGGQRASRAE